MLTCNKTSAIYNNDYYISQTKQAGLLCGPIIKILDMTPICNKCGRPAFNINTCEVAIFSLDGSQNKRVIKFYLCDRHIFEVEEYCRKQVTS